MLAIGADSELNGTLQLGGVTETVTVTGESPLVDVASKEVGGNLTAEDFVSLPTQGRSFVMFAGLLPGVQVSPDSESTASDSIFVNGMDDNSNSFNIDGANNDDDVIGATAGAQTRTAIEAIQEFQILTSQFDAEFGRAIGGVLNAITKSGGNTVHGSGFYYYQDSSINNKNFFTERGGLEQPDFSFKSIGGTLGGPVIRDKLFFFGSYERQTPNEGIAREFASRPEFNFTTSEENLLRNFMVKLDYQASSDHRIAARYLQEYSPQFNQIIGDATTLQAAREEFDRDTSFVGSIDSVLSDRAVNNLRISVTREDVAFANAGFNNNGGTFAAQRALDVSLNHDNILLGASTVASARINNSNQYDDTFSIYAPDFWGGDHDFRFGGGYSDRSVTRNDASTANGQFDFDTDAEWTRNDLSTYPTNFDIRVGGALGDGLNIPNEKVVGLFFQDDYQPVDNVTLNLGVRFDRQSTVGEGNIGPRLGFSWDPARDGQTVVRGGYGRFYDRYPIGTWEDYFLDSANLASGYTERIPGSGDDPQLFFDIVQANGFTNLNQLRDHLAAQLEANLGGAFNSAPTVDNPNRVTPYADTLSIGVEREITSGVSVGVDFVHTRNRDIQLRVDLNPLSNSLGGRPNISILNGQVARFNNINTDINGGESNTNSLQFSLQRRFMDSAIGRFSARVSYSYLNQSGNVEARSLETVRFQTRTESGYNFDTGQFIGAPLDLGLSNPAGTDFASQWIRPHNLVTSWSYQVPGTATGGGQGLMLSGVFRVMSGDRFTPQLTSRLDNNNRQIAPAGSYSANTNSDIALGATDSDGKENSGFNPNFSRLDLSLRYRLGLGQLIGNTNFQATVLFDIFNVTNRTNFSNQGSDFVNNSGFLIPTAARSPREFQLGVRVDF